MMETGNSLLQIEPMLNWLHSHKKKIQKVHTHTRAAIKDGSTNTHWQKLALGTEPASVCCFSSLNQQTWCQKSSEATLKLMRIRPAVLQTRGKTHWSYGWGFSVLLQLTLTNTGMSAVSERAHMVCAQRACRSDGWVHLWKWGKVM